MRHRELLGALVWRKKGEMGMTRLTWPSLRPRLAVVGFALAVAAGCTLTQRAPLSVQSEQSQSYCPFLGNSVCAKLTATTDKKEADLRYVNPSAQWTQYNKVLIEPVSYWGGDDTKLSGADQRTLTNYFKIGRAHV